MTHKGPELQILSQGVWKPARGRNSILYPNYRGYHGSTMKPASAPMRSGATFAVAILLLLTESLTAQQATAVVSAGDFKPGIATLGIASAFGTSLSTVTIAASTLPLPTVIAGNGLEWCDLTVDPGMLNCSYAKLFFVSPTQINFVVPDIGFSGSVQFHQFAVRAVLNGSLNSPVFKIPTIQGQLQGLAFAPRIFWEGYDCLADTRFAHPNVNCGLTSIRTDEAYQSDRGAVTDQVGLLLTSAHRAKLGQAYTIWMTGLGQSQNGKLIYQPGLVISNVPTYGYLDTYVNAKILYAGPSPQYEGLYQLNFILPVSIAGGTGLGDYPLFPCRDYDWEVSLDIVQGTGFGGIHANLVQIPIHVTNGDVPCAQ